MAYLDYMGVGCEMVKHKKCNKQFIQGRMSMFTVQMSRCSPST